MPAFTDRKGRQWNVELDMAVARVVDKSDFKEYYPHDFSILELNPDLLGKLFSKPSFMCAVLWAMLAEQAQARFTPAPDAKSTASFPISPKENPEGAELEFVSGFNGPTIEAARKALAEAIGDFFPDARIVLSTILNRLSSLPTKLAKKMEASETQELLDRLEDKEIDKAVEELKRKLGETSSTSPPSLT